MIGTGEFVGRLALAALLASLIGLERGRLERAAGLRTHALVSVGSCLFMLVSAFGFRDVRGVPQVVLDPSRVAAQVVSGGLYVPAACGTALMLLILAGVKPLERRLRPPRRQSLRLVIDQRSASVRAIRAAVEGAGLTLERILIEPGETPDEDRVELSVRRSSGVSSRGDDRVELVDRLRRVLGVQRIDAALTAYPSHPGGSDGDADGARVEDETVEDV